jgi:hypothetical protein
MYFSLKRCYPLSANLASQVGDGPLTIADSFAFGMGASRNASIIETAQSGRSSAELDFSPSVSIPHPEQPVSYYLE